MKRLILSALILPALLQAQNTSCSLSGTVMDSAGAVIPQAKVTVVGEGNGFIRTSVTNNDGFFNYPDLTPATFTLTVEAPGFKTYHQTGISITSSEQRSLAEIKLQVGQISDAVTVTAEAVSVNLASGERSGTLTGEQLIRSHYVGAISSMPSA